MTDLERPSGDAADGLDEERVTAWIDSLGVGAQPPLTFAALGHGMSNITLLVTDSREARWVLRRPPLGRLLASAHDVAREHRILSALQATGVPTPTVVALCTDPAVSDVPLLIMEYVDGVTIDDSVAPDATSGPLRRTIGPSMVGTLAAIHAVDVEAVGLADLASTKPYANRQLTRWLRQWGASRTRDLRLVEELAERLRAGVPEQHEVTLVHGDFHLSNVILHPFTGKVTAIIDWELCTLGDPLADLGALLAYWSHADDRPETPFRATTGHGFAKRADLLDLYERDTGRDLSALEFWHALALWKLAIICEGVRRRAMDDTRNAGGGAVFDVAAVDSLFTRAQQVADRAGL